jgi:hypothetical protein
MRRTILSLFGIALAIRALVAFLQVTYGISNEVNIDSYLYGPFNSGMEIYHDFYAYYVKQLVDLHAGLIPYKDFAYSYPPLFLYTLYPFFAFGGTLFASIPILISDAATSVVVLLVVGKISKSNIAIIAGLSYAFAPFFLLYEGYLWFSSQPMTFFLILSIYLLLTKRFILSSLMFAFAVLFKQEILLVLPIYFLWYLKNSPRNVLKSSIIICAVLLAVSIPFLMVTSGGYISSLSYGYVGHTYVPPLYPSDVSTNGVAQNNPNSSAMLACSTISYTWRSLICNFGGFTYTDYKAVPNVNVLLSPSFLNTVSPWITISFLPLIFYYFARLRSQDSSYFLGMATSLTGFLVFFALTGHPMYRYYLVPVYALILLASTSRTVLVLSAIVPSVALIFPSGDIQLFLPAACELASFLLTFSSASKEKKNLFLKSPYPLRLVQPSQNPSRDLRNERIVYDFRNLFFENQI